MLIPNRTFSSPAYRYGFNGMEKDDELKGVGNSYDFGARMLDPRVGRWSASDPKEAKFPSMSTYSYAFNNPTRFVDPTGMAPQESDPGKEKSFVGRLIDTFRGWFSKKPKTYVETENATIVSIGDEEPSLFSTEWFSRALSFDGWKNSHKETQFNEDRDVFLNSSLPQMAEDAKTMSEAFEYIPGMDVAISAGRDGDFGKATIQAGLMFVPFDEYIPKPLVKKADDIMYTAIGKMDDLLKYADFPNVDTWHKSGRIPSINGGDMVTWPENRKWIQQRIDRGDTFIMTMPPSQLPTERIPGKPNGWFTKLEYDYLVKKGAKIIYDF